MFLPSVSPSSSLLGLMCIVSAIWAKRANTTSSPHASDHATVLILGGGMTGIIAARTLHEQGVNDFIIVDAKTELGGRMISEAFGVPGRQVVVELGPSWIQGTQQGNGTANPIWELALKHNLSTVSNDMHGSVTTYDDSGYNDYIDIVNNALNNFDQATVLAGRRLKEGEVDLSLRSAYGIMGITPKTSQEVVSDYFQVDFVSKVARILELANLRVRSASLILFHAVMSTNHSLIDRLPLDVVAQSPSQTSWLASAWKKNFTYVPGHGGFSNVHQMSIDQRGFKYIVQAEAAEFLRSQQVIYNQTVSLVEYGKDTVTVHTTGGMTITADHVLCTFSVGVLQNNDVVFQPPLPDWKIEAINSIEMATYTKIFLQFNETFWFPTEMGLYASKQRGKYPVWQSLDHVGFFPGSGILSVTVTGDWALYIEQLTVEQVQSEILEVLRVMYPNITVPEPIAIHTSAWASKTLYRGSYANWGPSYVPEQSDNLKATVNNRLWFAGEATSTKHFGLLQGAYFEGQAVGYALAACIQGNGSCESPHTTILKNAQPYQSYLTSP